jgi:hypothetical protein
MEMERKVTTPVGRNRSVLHQTRFWVQLVSMSDGRLELNDSNRNKACRLVLIESPLEISRLVEGAHVAVELRSGLLRDAGLRLRRG